MSDDELVMKFQDILREMNVHTDCNFLTNKYKLGRKTYKTKTEFISAATEILAPLLVR